MFQKKSVRTPHKRYVLPTFLEHVWTFTMGQSVPEYWVPVWIRRVNFGQFELGKCCLIVIIRTIIYRWLGWHRVWTTFHSQEVVSSHRGVKRDYNEFFSLQVFHRSIVYKPSYINLMDLVFYLLLYRKIRL